jgi:hypothetical protein
LLAGNEIGDALAPGDLDGCGILGEWDGVVEKDGFTGGGGGEAEEAVVAFLGPRPAGFGTGPVVGPTVIVGVGFERAVGEKGRGGRLSGGGTNKKGDENE